MKKSLLFIMMFFPSLSFGEIDPYKAQQLRDRISSYRGVLDNLKARIRRYEDTVLSVGAGNLSRQSLSEWLSLLIQERQLEKSIEDLINELASQ